MWLLEILHAGLLATVTSFICFICSFKKKKFVLVSARLTLDGGHYGILCLFQAVCLQ